MIDFVKMHGLGNDFVVLDARGNASFRVDEAAARAIADRQRGIGCDQILVMRDAAGADLFMEILNSDGSYAGACGNGTRCVADLVMREGTDAAMELTIATDAGLLRAWRTSDADMPDDWISVDMGPAYLAWQEVPLSHQMDTMSVTLDGLPGPAICHSMGNPHAVVFVDDVLAIDLAHIGPLIEHNPIFPERVNLSIVQRVGDPEDRAFRMRVWERGVGITMACGSGACAVGVAIARNEIALSEIAQSEIVQSEIGQSGMSSRRNKIIMDGGAVNIDWQDDGKAGGRVVMSGPVAYAYHGQMVGEVAALLEAANG